MKVWKYGDDINTDMLFPGKYTYTCSTAEEIKPHLLEDLDPEFAGSVQTGDILFASPSADRLLSLQTEDELLVSCNAHPRQPLFTMLSSLVDHAVAADRAAQPWRGVLEFDDGRVMACEVDRLEEAAPDVPSAVLVLLQPVGSEASARIQAFSSSHGLSPREQEVLGLLEQGLTTGAMADTLGISPHTVRDHLKHLYRKTGVKGRGELLGLVARVSRSTAET